MRVYLNQQVRWSEKLRRAHRWLALFALTPIVIWLVSGLYIAGIGSWVGADVKDGRHLVNLDADTPLFASPKQLLLAPIARSYFPLRSVTLVKQFNQLVYQLDSNQTSTLLDAQTGTEIIIGKAYIKRQANAIYQGDGNIADIVELEGLSHLHPECQADRWQTLWQVTYDDRFKSKLCFSGQTGELIAANDDLSRWLAIASALHMMDIGAGKPYLLLFSLLLVLSFCVVGIWLIFYSFNRDDKRKPELGVLRGLHKWLAIFVGIQMLLWIISALVLNVEGFTGVGSLNDNDNEPSPSPAALTFDAAKINFNQLVPDNPQASQIAVIAGQSIPLIKFASPRDKSNATEAEVSGHLARQFFYMLHMMDYATDSEFDNPLLITTGSAAMLLAGIGFLMLIVIYLGGRQNAKPELFRIAISSRHGYIDTVMVDGGQPLLGALGLKDFSLPSGCGGEGTCCQCMVKAVGIHTPITNKEQTSLSVSEINQGFRLACQVQVQSDLAIEVSDQALAQKEFEVEVITNEFLTPFIKELVVSVPYGTNFSFDAGQFVNFHVPTFSLAMNRLTVPPQYQPIWQQYRLGQYQVSNQHAVERSYSMACGPTVNNKLVFNVGLALPKMGYGPGVASSYLFGLQPGDRMTLSGPLGEFVADPNSRREMIFVGAGTGLAPLKSHIDSILSSRSQRKVSLWFGARTEKDIFYQQHFDHLALRHRNFSWTVSLSKPESESWQGATGHIQKALFKDYLDNHHQIRDCDFFLCGPALMIKDVTGMLHRRGVSDSQIQSDDFGGSF